MKFVSLKKRLNLCKKKKTKQTQKPIRIFQKKKCEEIKNLNNAHTS